MSLEELQKMAEAFNGHVARRSIHESFTTSAPRSSSWSRGQMDEYRLSKSARSPRSKSMSRNKQKEIDELKDKRENAEAAFREWLKRKASEPRIPKASPSREAISRHLKEEAKQRVINEWHNNKRFQKKHEDNSDNSQFNS